MNDATTKLIDAAFEMSAVTKKPYPVEGSPEFFALTDVAHRLECACMAYKQARLAPPLPSIVDGKDGANCIKQLKLALVGAQQEDTFVSLAASYRVLTPLKAALQAAQSPQSGREEK